MLTCNISAGRDSSVGIATRCGLDGSEIESRWGGEIFRTRPYRLWGPPSLPIQWVPGLLAEGKAVGAWRKLPTPSSAEVRERVELYLDSPSGSSLQVIG